MRRDLLACLLCAALAGCVGYPADLGSVPDIGPISVDGHTYTVRAREMPGTIADYHAIVTHESGGGQIRGLEVQRRYIEAARTALTDRCPDAKASKTNWYGDNPPLIHSARLEMWLDCGENA